MKIEYEFEGSVGGQVIPKHLQTWRAFLYNDAENLVAVGRGMTKQGAVDDLKAQICWKMNDSQRTLRKLLNFTIEQKVK